MQTLEYEYNGKRTALSVPESFAEMTGEQLIAAAGMLLNTDKTIPNNSLHVLTGMPAQLIEKLKPYERYSIEEMFDFVFSDNHCDISFREWKILKLELNGQTYWSPSSNFGNVTWQEFIYADQCLINGYIEALSAALFRPERENYNGETDRRIPFTIYGTTYRFNLFKELTEAVKLAIVLNYKAMRRASLEETYPEIFPYHDNSASDASDSTDEEPETEPETKSDFSWTQVHRSLLGDRIEEEDKFLNLNVHTVLNRLNEQIIENRKNRK